MRRTKQRTEPITAADVRSIRFPLIRRGGYDPRQVDPFLELVARSLEEAAADGAPKVDAQYVHSVRFATVRRGGYAPTAVDAFLDRVIDTLDPVDEPPTMKATPPRPEQTPQPERVQADFVAAATSAGGAVALAERPPPPAPGQAPPPPSPEVVGTNGAALVPTVASAPATTPTALEVGRAHLERLKELYESGILSDTEVTVLAKRVKRKAREMHQAELQQH